MIDADIRARALELLAGQTTLVLATSNTDGSPSAAPLFYCVDDSLQLRWLSSPSSLHSRNVSERPETSISVSEPVTDWRAIRGVQMRGLCSVEKDPAFLEVYRRRFSLGPEFDPAIAASSIYVFHPLWLRYIDNAFGFGFRAELTL